MIIKPEPIKIISADPPWGYNDRSPHADSKFGGGVHGQYPTMTLDEMKSIPVKEIVADNSILFLWTTWPHLKTAMRLMPHWGFRYVTLGFIWVKTNWGDGRPFFGTGFYAKHNSEPCLLGVRGSMEIMSNSISQVLEAPYEVESETDDKQDGLLVFPRLWHSKKPDLANDKMVQLVGDGPKVEMFARRQYKDWLCLGNEIDGRDIRESVGQLAKEIKR